MLEGGGQPKINRSKMRVTVVLACCALLLACAGLPSLAADDYPVAGRATEKLAEALDDAIVGLLRERGVPGASVSVTNGGRLVYSRGFGHNDAGRRSEVKPWTGFRVASVSKSLTAFTVLHLVDRGLVNLDDRVFETHLARLAPAPNQTLHESVRGITVMNLLQMTSGWDLDGDIMFASPQVYGSVHPGDGNYGPATCEDAARALMSLNVTYAPGTRYRYENANYCLLSLVVRFAGGAGTYEEYAKEHLFGPVNATAAHFGETHLADLAADETNYFAWPGQPLSASVFPDEDDPSQSEGLVEVPYGSWFVRALAGAGAWVVSSVDLLRAVNHFDPRIGGRWPQLYKSAATAAIIARVANVSVNPAERGAWGAGMVAARISETTPEVNGYSLAMQGSLPGTNSVLGRFASGLFGGETAVSAVINTRARNDTIGDDMLDLLAEKLRAVTDWPGESVDFFDSIAQDQRAFDNRQDHGNVGNISTTLILVIVFGGLALVVTIVYCLSRRSRFSDARAEEAAKRYSSPLDADGDHDDGRVSGGADDLPLVGDGSLSESLL